MTNASYSEFSIRRVLKLIRIECFVSLKVMIGNTSVAYQSANRLLKNVFEAADARQKQAKKRSLCLINEHFEPVFNTAAETQIVFQRPVNGSFFIRNRYHDFQY